MFRTLKGAKTGHHTILTLSKDEKYMEATPGIVSILHTNGQDLTFPARLCHSHPTGHSGGQAGIRTSTVL